MSVATLGGSLGALAVVVLAWMTGRAIGGGMVAMLWMAGGMGGVVDASLTCRHPSGSPGFRR